MPTEDRKFMYIESSQIPLKEVPYGDLKANLTDPTTGKPYQGIVLEGPFACLKETPNNNKRVYSIPEYLELLEKLKKQIHSSKGVYGELEHPEKYSVNFNNVSHKILDVWWVPEEQMVYGRVLILNTPKGKIAQEIIKSGGQLAISARAAGEEIQQPDGTLKAITKLLTTYDLVYHPGFSEAVLEFKELNESQKFLQNASSNKKGFGFKIYQNQFNKIPNAYLQYINLNESSEEDLLNRKSKCFLEWFGEKLNESENQEKEQEQKIEENDVPKQKQKQNKLEKAVQKDLKEEKLHKLKQEMFFQEVECAQNKLRKKCFNREDKAYYDNSAGFVSNEPPSSFSTTE